MAADITYIDQGREFVNKVQEELYKIVNLLHITTSKWLSEMYEHTMQTAILTCIEDQRN